MGKLNFIMIIVGLYLSSCNMETDKTSIEKWKQEILDTEQSFAQLLAKEGMHKAFVAYADEDAVLMRNDDLVKGKNAIDAFYKGKDTKNLVWKPESVEVAASGDMGYTYGYYTFTSPDDNGKMIEYKGVFHTVWKKQPDGTWKFVWD